MREYLKKPLEKAQTISERIIEKIPKEILEESFGIEFLEVLGSNISRNIQESNI